MKKKIFVMIAFVLSLVMLAACQDTVNVTFSEAPAVTKGVNAGDLVLKAKATNESGEIIWAVYGQGQTELSVDALVSGAESLKKGTAIGSLNTTVTLSANTTYQVFFVIKEGTNFSSIVRVEAQTDPAASLSFSTLAVVGGDENGTLKINAQSNGLGTIYFVLVALDSAAPTAAQIVAGADYGDVVVLAHGNGAAINDFVVTDLVADTKYDAHFVIKHNDEFSSVRKMSGTARRLVEVVDKGEGTAESPFRISTVEDLENVGRGYYEVTDKDWLMESHYVLENDIDLTAKYGEGKLSWPVLGADSMGLRFAGTLDGAGFAIIGLYIGNDSEAGIYRGLFASSEASAVVKNLVIKNSYVRDSGMDESNSNHGTGLLFGYFKGLIENVNVYESEVYATGTRVGGLAGRSYVTGSIYNSYVNAKVTGVNRVGGFVGVVDVDDNASAAIQMQNLIFNGSVIGKENHIGGIAGYARGVHIANAIVLGYIQGSTATGGIVGFYQKRSGNNNVSAMIENTIVYATVYGVVETDLYVGYTVGNLSTSGAGELLKYRNNFYVEGSAIYGGVDATATSFRYNGEMVAKASLVDPDWYNANLSTMDFDHIFEIKEEAERPSLVNTLDNGLLPELVVPLVAIVDVKAGLEEKELAISISSNKTAVIYYVVVAAQMELTAAQIKEPDAIEGLLHADSAASIKVTYTMAEYDTTYYVYYLIETVEGEETILAMASGNSKAKTALVISGGLKPGYNDSDLILNLSTNLPSTIYYIIVGAEGEYTKDEIMNPSGVLHSGNGKEISKKVLVMAAANTEYFYYAIAIADDRESVVTSGSGLSSSDDVINYGDGTEANPFIIRTVADFEAIGRGNYTNEAGEVLAYANNKSYEIVRDIDLSAKYGEGKESWTPIPELKAGAVIDGGGYSITGLYHSSTTEGQKGFITYLNGGVVKNMTFVNIHIEVIEAATPEGNANTNSVAFIAGRAQNATAINIRVINGYLSAPFRERCGGIFGEATQVSIIDNIYVEAEITAKGRVGGIVGNATTDSAVSIVISNIVFIGNVVKTNGGDARGGAIVGWSRGVAYSNIYAEGTVSSVDTAAVLGALAGYVECQSNTNLNSSIKNVIVNVTIIGGSSSSLVASGVGSSGKAPTPATGIYYTENSSINDSKEITDLLGELLPSELSLEWFEANMPGLIGDKWELVAGVRPQLKNSPDLGLIDLLTE